MSLCTIVGMGPGIGLSVATRFAKEGFDIAMVARNLSSLLNYSIKLGDSYDVNAYGFVADAGNFVELEKTFKRIQQKGAIDVLIYNAAVLEKTHSSLSPEKLMNHYQVNVGGAVISSQQVIPAMEKKGRGTILFTGGGFAHEPNPNYVSLSMGKAALLNYGHNLAEVYEPKGIHVALVSIFGKVARGSRYDPDLIAEKYWQLHNQPREKWEREVQVR